jgi:hypothetical protein
MLELTHRRGLRIIKNISRYFFNNPDDLVPIMWIPVALSILIGGFVHLLISTFGINCNTGIFDLVLSAILTACGIGIGLQLIIAWLYKGEREKDSKLYQAEMKSYQDRIATNTERLESYYARSRLLCSEQTITVSQDVSRCVGSNEFNNAFSGFLLS